jgi:hypothetical protein
MTKMVIISCLFSATGKVFSDIELNFEDGGQPKLFTITYKVQDQDGAAGASSTGILKINVEDINEKPTIVAVAKPDPNGNTVSGVSGTGTAPWLVIGVPELYSGPIHEFTFTDPDIADTPAISIYSALKLTLPTTAGITNPFTITKNAANKGRFSAAYIYMSFP